MFPTSTDRKADEVKSASESYHKYKRKYVKHLCFNPDNENLSKCFLSSRCLYTLPATMLEHAPLEAVYIYFDTATYDEIGRDEKVR